MFLLFGSLCKAQTPSVLTFAPNKTQWIQQLGFWYINGPGGNVHYNIWYDGFLINGDTVINNKLLQKFYYAGTNKIDTICANFDTYIYNDSNKIYYGTNPDSMVLAYNFNIIKGDSFPINGGKNYNTNPQTCIYYPKVDSTTIIFYAGKNRKWIRFSLLPYSTRIIWLEGVGDASYGIVFNDYFSIMRFNSFNTSECGFNCFADGDNGGSCPYNNCTPANIEQNKSMVMELNIYPSPVNKIVNVELSGQNGQNTNDEIQIISMLGERIKSEKLEGKNNLQIDVSDLQNGVYFITLKDKHQKTIAIQKIVVQR